MCSWRAGTTRTLSFSVANDDLQFGMRLLAPGAFGVAMQRSVGHRRSFIPAVVAASIASKPSHGAMTRRLFIALVLILPVLAWRLDRPGFSDTEGMFAEPAREMVLTGDWVTPRMNGQPFLTKPPLMYWLPAALFSFTGPTEYARIWPAIAALGTVAVTGALGGELFGERAGVAAAVALATSLGFLVEARMLRADMLLVLCVTLALYCYVRLRRGTAMATGIGFWIAIAVGVLDKGLVALLLPLGVIGVAEHRGPRIGPGLRGLNVPRGIAIVTAIVMPWYGLAVYRNPGFLWDSMVNEQILRFFHAKLPRDFVPDSLPFFWAMFAARTLPWSPLLPAAVVHAVRARTVRPALRLAVGWMAVVLGFFSLSPSRLEHYSLPALPAVSLVVGVFLTDAAARRECVGRSWGLVPLGTAAVAALTCALCDPSALIVRLDPMFSDYRLSTLVRPAAIVTGAGLVMLALSLRGRAATPVGAVIAVAIFGFVQIAHERVEPLFSWRSFARILRTTVPRPAPVFFRASDEYQLCGGLDYYTRSYVRLLPPANWVPPAYLAGRTGRLFTPRATFERVWHHRSTAVVSDDVEAPGAEAAIAPSPFIVLAHQGGRVLLWSGVPGISRPHSAP